MKANQSAVVSVRPSHRNRKPRKSARRAILATSASALLALFALTHSTPAVAAVESFTFNPALSIPDGNLAGAADARTPASLINVIQGVTVGLNIAGVPANLGFNGDLYVYLSHITPGGSGISVLLNRVGKSAGNPTGFGDSGFNVTLSDAAAVDIHVFTSGGPAVNGTFQADGRNISPSSTGAQFDVAPRATLASAFNGLSAKGGWTLFVADAAGGNQHILNSWSLNLTGIAGGFFWKGGTNNLWSNATGANWATDATGATNILASPDATADVTFSTTVAGFQNTTLGADIAIKSLTINDGTPVQINGANTLTISGTGINVTNTAGAVTIGAGLVLTNAADTITVSNAGGLSINGAVGGGNGLTKLGIGTLTLGNTNTYTGATTVTAGTLSLGSTGSTPAGSTVNIGTAGTLGGAGTVLGNATVTGSGVINFAPTGNITGTLGATGGSWNGQGTVGGNVNVTGGTLTIGSGANLTTNGTVNVSGTATISAGGGASSTITGNLNVTSTAGSFLYSGVIAGAASAVTVNNPNPGGNTGLGLLGPNTYGGVTTITSGFLFAQNAGALGQNGGGAAAQGTVVLGGGALGIAGVVIGNEALTINGAGNTNFSNTGAALVGAGAAGYGGVITLGSDATIGVTPNGNSLALTGGVDNAGRVLTLKTTDTSGTAGVINITTAGISGAAANSNLIVDHVTVNEGFANTYNGATFIRSSVAAGSGVLNANVLNALPTASGRSAVTLDDAGLGGSKLIMAASQSILSLTSPVVSSQVQANANTLTVGSPVAGTTNFFGVISGAGAGLPAVSLVKDGGSTQIMSGLNTYTGSTQVNGGILRAGLASQGALGGAFGVSPIVNVGNGGTLDLGGFDNAINQLSGVSGGFVDNSGGPVALLTAGDSTNALFAGIIKNSGSPLSLTKVGSGTLTLAGVNTYSGPTIVSIGGILEVTVSAGNTPLGLPIQGTTVNAGAALRLQSNATTGAEPLNLNGNGVGGVGGALVVLPGTSIIGGPVTLGGGAGSTTTITAGAATTIIFSGGINKDNRTLVFDGRGGGQFFVNTNPISGPTSFTSDFVVNGGTTTFSTQNSYSGPTWIGNGGTLNATVVGALPAPPADGGIAGVRTLVVLDPDSAANPNFPAGAPASITPSTAPSTLNISANQAIQSLASANTPGIGQASFVSLGNSRLTIGTGAGSVTFFGVIGGGALGSVVKDGLSTQILAGNNTYNGPTTVQGGILQIGVGGVAGTPGNLSGVSAVTVNPAAFLDLNLGNNGTFANNVADSGTVRGINTAGNTQTVSGVITGTGNLLQTGAGTTILTNINTYQGGTIIGSGAANGTIQVGSGAQQGSVGTGNVTFNGPGILNLVNVNGNVFANNVSNTSAGLGVVRSSPALGVTTTISGALTGAGGGPNLYFIQNSPGTTVLTNAGNTYSASGSFIDDTSIGIGTVQIGTVGSPSLPGSNVAGRFINIYNGGTLALVNVVGNTINDSITNGFGGVGTVNVNSQNNNTLAGPITASAGTIALQQTGSGTTTLTSATNGINGSVTVSAGGLTIGTGASPSRIDAGGATSVNVGTGGVLTLVNLTGALANNIGNTLGGAGSVIVNSANANTLSGVLSNASGTLSLTQSGAGTTTLTGANTYTGATLVTAGHLQIGNGTIGSISGGSAVTVNSGAFLDINLVNNGVFSNNIATAGTVQGINTAGNTQGVSGVISGLGAFIQNVGGTTIFLANNTYVGGATISAASAVTVGQGAFAGSVGTGAVTLNGTGGTLNLVNVNGNTFANNVNGAAGTDIVNVNSLNTNTLSGAYTGLLSLIQIGSGPAILTGAGNNYTGTTIVNAGTLQIGTALNASLAGSNVVANTINVGSGGTIALVNVSGGTLNNNITNSLGATGTVNANSATALTLAGAMTAGANALALTQTGAGTTTLTNGANVLSSATVSAGGLTIGTGGSASRIDAAGTAAVNVGTGGVLTLVNLIAPTFSNNIGNTLGGAGSVVVNSATAITLSGILSNAAGTLSLTQSGAGTTTLTNNANSYTGATNVTAGTLQIGNAVSGNITSSPINVSGGATLGINLGTGQTLPGNIANGGTISSAITLGNTQTLNGAISGLGVFNHVGAGTTILTGASNYTGATNVNAGILRVNGSLGATTVTVANGAVLGGTGSIGGPVSIASGGFLTPGNSPGTLTMASLTLVAGSNSNFELNLPGIVGQAALPGNDLVNVTGNLVLAGNINVTQNPTISAGSYRLFNYGGVLTNNGTIINVAPAAPGLTEQLVFGVPGQVNLLVLNSAAIGITQFWDGAHANNTTIEGGTASWDNFNNNWTTAAGTTNSSWQNGVANFGAVAGTVTLVDNINAQGLVFGTTGYVIQGSGAFTLNLVGGAAPAPFVTVTAGLTATINAPITGSAGLTSNGGGTLVLTNAANAYTGGTTITGGGAISVAADGALGATGVGNGLTLNGGSLIATAGFTSARTVALTGIGTVDVTGANVLALTGIISGAAGNTLTKVDTGTLNLTGVNTYAGGTAIVAGTVQITNDGNLGNIVGGVTFGGVLGGNATLQTLGAVTSARAITLNLGGGTVDTNGFNSTLSGIIGGAAGNPLTKIGAGTLTVTGASTYLGQTNVNAGTLQVGDGATAGTQIGNNAATVVVNTGGTLAINLPAGGTFGNAVTNNFGGVINAITAANSQTVSGVISGAGVFNQNGAGTTILTNNANSYTGATNVLLGHLQIGNGTTGNLASGTAVSVSAGAFLDLNLANNATFAPTNIADSGAVQGINTVGNTQTVSGVIGGVGTFAQTGAGTTIFTGVNTFAGGTTANNAGLVQVGTAALTGALGSGAVTLGNAGGTLNLVNVSGNTFANNVAGTGGTDTVNVNSVNTNTLSGAYTGTLSLNQIGAGTTILTNAGNIYTAGTRVSAGTLQVGTAALPGSVGQNLAANTISVSGGGTLTFVNLAAATNPLLNNITNGVGAVGLVNANSASTITLGGTLTNGALGTLALTQSGTGTTILTNAGNTYTGATTVSAGTLQIGTGVNAGSIGSAAVAVTTGGILSLINVGGPVANTFSNAVSNGVLGNGTVNVGGITNPLIISGVLSDGAAGTLSLTQSGTGKTILTATDTYTGATNVSAGTLQVGNGATGSISGSSAVTVSSPGILDVNLLTGTTFGNAVSSTGAVRGINVAGTTETFSGVISGTGSFSQISGTGIFTNVNSYGGGTNITGAATVLQIGTAGLAAAAGSATINVGGGSTLQLVNVNGNVLSNNVTNAAGGGAGTVLSTSALTTTLSGTLTDGAGTLALTQNGSGTTILANFNNTYTGLTTVSAGTLQLGTNALAGSLGGGATIKVGTGGTLSLVNIGNPGTLSNALITNTLGGVGTVNILSNNNNTVSSQLTDGGPGTLQLTQTGLGTTTLLGANTYTGTTLISAGILQVGNGGAAGLLGTGAVTDNASLIFNRSDTITVANAISGSGSVTQQGGGTTILTGANTYGATAINAGTLQIGAGGVAGSLGTGIVTDNAALVFNRSDAITVANAINGSGTLTQQGTGNTNLTGVSTYSGATTVANGTLRVNGSLGFTAVTVNSGATLGGNGTIAGSVSILSGGNLAPGNSPGTITVGSLTLVTGSNSNFELGQPGVIGQASLPGNDLVNVNTNLVLAGNINVTQLAGFGAGSYRLFNYGGALTNNGTIVNGVPGPAVSAQIITGVPNQVNLLVLNANFVGLLQNWDGGGVANDGIIAGGNGTWDGFQNNWTNNAGTVNAAWQNGVANFGGATGTVTLVSPIFAQGLVFSTTGYNINGTGINVLNLVGPTPAPTVTVSGGLLATINAQILGSAGLTANGAGTLVLTNAGNSYTGGTTVTGGGAVSVSSDGNLGNAAGAITLNTGTLQTTATFASSRGITLTGTGTFDVTNANVFTASGVIGGTGALTKINTGTLVLGNAANTYNGPTNIVNGTVQVSANGNLGAVTGGLTFGGAAGNNAILQTTAGITFGNRAVTLNTAGGTIDTNGFNSSLSGVISGIAGNPLTKVGAGTLTLTGASTYLGQTNVNGGTLQVGDGVVVGTMIGNNTATVVLNNGAPLAINLANSGTFGNPVTANAGSTVIGNNTVGNTQTVTGIISGAGAVTQSGAGTTVLTAANSYNGATLVSAGTLQIGNGLAVGASITNSVSVTVNVGATLAIQLANNEAFSNNVADNGTVNLLSANTQTISGIIGGAGVLNQSGAGTAILTGNNTYAGITTISAGTLQIGSGGVSGSLGAGNVTDNSNLVFNRSDSIVIGNLISGTGTLRQQGNGVTTLIATNTYTGATTVANGTLQIGNGSTVGSSIATSTPAVAVNAGATLAINLANGETFSNGVTDNGTVNGISTGTQTLSGAITGSGVLNQNGTGTMILTGTNTYAGVTTINAGRLQIGNGGATGTLGGGAVTDNGALIFNRNNPMTVGNLISGNGTVSQQGVGGTTILTAANSYSGATTVTQGTLQIGDGVTPLASITNSVSTTVNLGAALAINLVNGETFTNNVTDNGAVNGINTGANVQTLSGSITGSGTLNQTGTGTTILTGTNSYQGITNIAAGTIQVGNGGTIGTLGSGNVTDNGALIFNRSNLMTVANVISGGGTVRQQGTGTTILTATNTYGGATTVAFGTLQIGDGATPLASIASSAVTVNSGATLAINLAPNETFVNSVTDNGAVNGISANTQTLSGVISGGGTLNQNGAGTMILTGANTYAGVTTITAGTLQVGAGAGGGATGQLGAGNVVDNGALVFNRSNAITVANAISGSGTLTQQGNGTTTLTGVGTYGGVTNVTAGTLQIGDGTSGNITSPQINVSGGAALAVRLANNATLVGNIANTGTINTISANTQTLSGNISGTGVFNQTGAGITVLTGASNYTGATTVVNGNLRVNGSLGNTALTVQTGATLSGTGSIAGTVTILSGGNLNPGTSPGTITTGTLVLNAGSNLNFELGTAGVIGQQALPGNDLVNVNGNLTLDGNLNVTPNPAITSGSYRLFNYTGTLTNNTIDSITGVNAAFTPLIVTAAAGQVNLLVLANGTGPVQFWDGVGPANNGVANGGSGNWDNFTMNWTGVAGANPNASWQNGTAVFNAPAGTVTITDTTNAQGLIFGTSGYVINSSGGNTLNLVGQNPAVNNVPFISVTNASDVATINAVVSNFYSPAPIPFGLNGGLTSTGAGKLVLTNVGNTYTGGTTITGGGTVSISDDHNLGAIPGAPGINDITLNNGALQATATFTLNSNRSIILAGAGGIDVTGTDRLTYGGVISGAGSLAKTGTGILTISGVNTYQGGTLILGGTLEISNNNNLGNVAGAVTFGNGATLKTLAGITSARAISLGAVANTGGGVIDTNGFNSTLTGIITGAAGNGLVKNGAGILTVTGASTYLGTTTINTGTLQVGDNATAGAQIGNNAANVIVGSGAILDVRLTDGGTFNNTIATALGATINSTNSAGATQTFGGIISGAGIFNQNGLGTAVLNGANTYTGQTNVNFGTVVLGNATALGTIAAGTVVASGATLDLNGQTVGAEALTIGGAGVGGNGALINGSIAVAASLSGPVSLTADTTITTFSANANATPGGSILLSGNVSGGFGIIKNGNGTLTLTGLNIYTGQTLINAGILQAGNNFALGSVGANTVVASGASLQILNGVAVVGEPVVINGFGAGVAAPGALTQSLNGSSSLAGAITVATNANISTNGTGIMTLTGGITKNGTTLTLNGGGTININGVGISGVTSFTSDLVVDGTGVGGLTVVNMNAANSYAGPTWITNGGTLNANVLAALPSTAADGLGGTASIRTTVIMDPVAAIPGTPPSPSPSSGGSILNLGASQAIQSLTGAVSSRVNLGTKTLTIGTTLGGATTFAGVISGANAAGASIIKDGTSTQIFSGPNNYTGSTTVKGGTLQAGVATVTPAGPVGTVPTSGAFGVDSVMTVNAGGTLELAGFSNTIGSLVSTPLPGGGTVQNTTVGNNAPATLTIDGINAAGTAGAVNFGGVIKDTAATALSIVKNGAGTQIFSGANTYIGTTTVDGGILQAGVATVTPAGPAGTVPTSGAFGVDSATTVNAGSVLELAGFSNTIGSLSGGGAGSFVQNTLNNAATLTIDGINAAGPAGAVTYGGVIKDTTGTALSIVKNGAGTQIFSGLNSYVGMTTVNGGILQSGVNTNAGNTGGAFGVNSATTVGTSATAATLALNGFSNTIGTLSGNTSGIIQNGSAANASVLTFGSGAVSGTTTFSGVIQNGGAATLSLIKVGTGIQVLAGTAANTYTGLTTVNAGELHLNKTAGVNAIGGNLTIGDGLGGANSDIVKLLANDQILATSLVLIDRNSGRLDLNGKTQTVGSIDDTGTVILGGSSINLGSGTLTTGAGGGANPANPNTAFSGVISGTNGNLTKTGTGIFTLNGTNTYTGATNVNAGTLRAGSTQAFGSDSAVTIAAAGTLDLAGKSNSIGSLTGPAGGFVRSSTGSATLTTGDLNADSAFLGVLQDNVGPLSLVKTGNGRQTLGGTNTYTGTTTVNGGTLLAASASAFGSNSATTVNAGGTLDLGGNSNTIGSLSGVAGGTVRNSTGNPATLTTGGLNTNTTFSGTIQNGAGAPLAFLKNGTGTQILSGTNSYTGGTTLNAGTLAAGSTKAFGSGNLTLLGGTLRTSGGPLIVDIGSGNVLFGGGTYVANVGGVIPGAQHDQLTTTGAANIGGGTLALVQQNAFQLAPGAQVNLLVASSGVAGGSALGTPVPAANVTGLSAFSSTPLLVPVVNLYLTTVTLEAMQGSFAGLGGVFGPNGQFIGFTPNQIATARALDSVSKTINFKTGILAELNYLDTQPLGTLPSNLDKIAPEEFAAFFQNSVALANVQTANLGRRMDDIRNQASAPSASGLAAAGSGPSYSGGLSGPSGKRSKEVAAPNDERWGAFLTGSGEFTHVGSTTNAAGYRFETAGVTGGLDYRVNDHFAIGMNFGYVGTTSTLVNGGKIETDGGRLGLYATYFDKNFHVDAAVTGGLNSYETRRTTPNNTSAIASPEGSEINVLIAAGYDWKVGKFTVGPTASYQYTNVHTDGFTETGAFAPLSVNGQSTESSRTSLGIRAYYDAQVAGIVIRPELRISWQHEFGDAAPTVTSRFSTLGGNPFTVTGPQIGRDSVLLGAGFTVLWSERLATYLYYDGEVGRSNYDSHNISGGIRLQF